MAIASEDKNIGSNVQLGRTNSLIICAFLTIAWYNVAELTILIQSFFKRYAGFYYYSLLVATWGIFLHGLGMFLKFYHINQGIKGEDIINTVIVWTGWCMMVTGQSIVLYSRLHLVAQAKWTKYILWLIIFDGVVLHSVTGVATFLTNTTSTPQRWIPLYSVVEKVQITCFFLQEVLLSGIYIWKTTGLLKIEGPLFDVRKNVRKRVLVHTIAMSAIIIALDVILLGLEFKGLYDIQTSFKGAVYSIKLKMEFSILNQLMNLVRGRLRDTEENGASYTTQQSQTTNDHDTPITPGTKPSYMTSRSRFSRHNHVVDGTENHHHTVGAYSRMDDDVENGSVIGRPIRLEDLKGSDVLKTTAMEMTVERTESIHRNEGLGIESDVVVPERVEGSHRRRRSSSASSEVYVIEMCEKDDRGRTPVV